MNLYDATEAAYKNGYADAVRDIFEEIEKAIGEQYPIYTVESIIKCVAELKKKYTEEIYETKDSHESL